MIILLPFRERKGSLLVRSESGFSSGSHVVMFVLGFRLLFCFELYFCFCNLDLSFPSTFVLISWRSFFFLTSFLIQQFSKF